MSRRRARRRPRDRAHPVLVLGLTPGAGGDVGGGRGALGARRPARRRARSSAPAGVRVISSSCWLRAAVAPATVGSSGADRRAPASACLVLVGSRCARVGIGEGPRRSPTGRRLGRLASTTAKFAYRRPSALRSSTGRSASSRWRRKSPRLGIRSGAASEGSTGVASTRRAARSETHARLTRRTVGRAGLCHGRPARQLHRSSSAVGGRAPSTAWRRGRGGRGWKRRRRRVGGRARANGRRSRRACRTRLPAGVVSAGVRATEVLAACALLGNPLPSGVASAGVRATEALARAA